MIILKASHWGMWKIGSLTGRRQILEPILYTCCRSEHILESILTPDSYRATSQLSVWRLEWWYNESNACLAYGWLEFDTPLPIRFDPWHPIWFNPWHPEFTRSDDPWVHSQESTWSPLLSPIRKKYCLILLIPQILSKQTKSTTKGKIIEKK